MLRVSILVTLLELTFTDILPVRSDDYRYLWYGTITNSFDSAKVSASYGEFSLIQPNEVKRLYLSLSDTQWKSRGSIVRESGSSCGRIEHLANVVRTETFVVPQDGASLSFFRALISENNTEIHSNVVVPSGEDRPTDWREVELSVANAAWILDESAFTLEVVRASDSVVLAVIDSVNIKGNPGHTRAMYSGSAPKDVVHTVALPLTANGQTVFIRAVPYRYGTTPLGMYARIESSMISKSSYYKSMPTSFGTLPRKLDPLFADTVIAEYIDRIEEYWNEDTTRSCLPVIFDKWSFPPQWDSVWNAMLNDNGFFATGARCDCDSAWYDDSVAIYETLVDGTGFPKRGNWRSRKSQIASQWHPTVALSVNPSVVSNKTLRFSIESNGEYISSVAVYDVRGNLVRVIWSGKLPVRDANVAIDLPAGKYFVGVTTDVQATRFAQVVVE